MYKKERQILLLDSIATIQPSPRPPIESVEIESVFSRATKSSSGVSWKTKRSGGRVGFKPEKYFCITCHTSGLGFQNSSHFGANTLILASFRTFRLPLWVSVPTTVKDHPAPAAPVRPLAGVSDSRAPFAAHLFDGPRWPSIG